MEKFEYDNFIIDFKNPLGQGGFGDVFKAIEKKLGKFMQLKEFRLINLKNLTKKK